MDGNVPRHTLLARIMDLNRNTMQKRNVITNLHVVHLAGTLCRALGRGLLNPGGLIPAIHRQSPQQRVLCGEFCQPQRHTSAAGLNPCDMRQQPTHHRVHVSVIRQIHRGEHSINIIVVIPSSPGGEHGGRYRSTQRRGGLLQSMVEIKQYLVPGVRHKSVPFQPPQPLPCLTTHHSAYVPHTAQHVRYHRCVIRRVLGERRDGCSAYRRALMGAQHSQ